MKRKLLSVLLTLAMALTLLPVSAMAEGETANVAKVGDTEHTTLQAAIDAASSGAEVKLIADTNENVTIGKNITLDLGGKTLTNTNAGKATLTVAAGATATVKNGSIVGGTGHYNIAVGTKAVPGGNLTLEGVTATAGNNDSSMIDNWGTLTIKSGTYTGGLNVVKSEEGSTLNINGGKFTLDYAPSSGYTATILVYGDTTITGGEFIQNAKPKWGNPQVVMTGVVEGYTAITKITGGTFTNKKSGDNIFHGLGKATSDNFEVSGGTFNKSISDGYCADGFIPTKNADGTYGVKEGKYVAAVGSKKYETLADAIRLAARGKTVKLLDDVTLDAAVKVPAGKTVTLDLNGKALSTSENAADNTKHYYAIDNYGTFTLQDSSTEQSGEIRARGIENFGGGKMVIKSGKIVAVDANGGAAIWNLADLTIEGGTFVTEHVGASGDTYGPGCVYNNAGTLTINGGTFTSANKRTYAVVSKSGAVTIEPAAGKNVEISGAHGGLGIDGGTATIKGGSYASSEYYGLYVSNDAGTAEVTVTGGTFDGNKYAVLIGSDGAGSVNSTLKIEGGTFNKPIHAQENTGTGAIQVSGGLFSSDVTKYCAEGLMAVTNTDSTTNTTYPYTIGEVPSASVTDIEEHTEAGATDGSVGSGVADADRAAAATVASSVNADETGLENAAGTVTVTDTEKKTAIQQLLADNQIELNDDGTVKGDNVTITIIKQPYLDVEVTALDSTAKELSLTIEPKYNLLATTNKTNESMTVVVSTGNALTVTGEMEVKLALPNGFAAAGNKLSIKHTKGNGTVEYYTGTVSEESSKLYVTFTTKGFSPFTISAPAASIGETMYPTLAEAIAKAANGNTVKLEKNCEESVTVSGKSLTIDKNNYVYDFTNVTVDSNSTKTENGDTLTITYTAPSSSSGSSGYYVSTPSKTEHGTVTVSPKSASKGDTVTVTVKPDSGYVLETLTVTDKNGNELTLKDKGNGKYTFTMPAGKVEVKATFMEDNSMLNFFYDVPNNAYFYEAVKWAVKNGITTGVGNDLFAPEQPCTRAQIVTFLWRAAGSPEPKGAASGMTDVVSGSYYEKAVAWAIENGITTGTTTSTFSPDATCTRAQAVTFLARALNAKAASAAEFSDVPTDSYFADAVAWAAANGVTEGIGGGLFGSDNDCTRGQIVTFLYRAYNK